MTNKLNTLSIQQISLDILEEKYFKLKDAGINDIYARVARAMASAESTLENKTKYEQLFFENMHKGAIGAGRIMSAAGTEINATLINCFVQPVGDCIQGFDEDGYPGIYEALRDAAETMRRGGGVGYDFSRIRPRGAFVKGTASMASGPCSYINVFDQSCSTVESAGARRGAQMGVLRIDHPDILEFIVAKRTPGRWNNFNVSVGVTDEFMHAVESGTSWELVHKSKPTQEMIDGGSYQRADGLWVYKTIQAKELYDTIMKSTYDYAEPGILFLSRMNSDNNLSYCEKIEATNPCGEQPLPSYGCCDLGPIILTKFVKNPFGMESPAHFDYESFKEVVKLQVRALDNILDVTFWPLSEQRAEAQAKRRIGVGYTGLGDTLIMLKLKYNSEEGRSVATLITQVMRDAAYEASIELAKEKGAFAKFDAVKYLQDGTFASRLPEHLKEGIKHYGIRNSHLLSIAPTGTVSLAFADNCSNGIEPSFSWTYKRKKRNADGSTMSYDVEDHAWRLYRHMGGDVNNLPDYFVSALSMSAGDHLEMLACVQPFVDTAISKTVNIPVDYPFEDFKKLYMQAWKRKLKGLATFRPNNILGAVLETGTETKVNDAETKTKESKVVAQAALDPMRTVIEKRHSGALPAVTDKVEYWGQEGKKTLYLIVSFLPVKTEDGRTLDRAIEFFIPVGQDGESQQWVTSSMRLLSLAARGGFLERALNDMRNVSWDRGPVRLGFKEKEDGTKVPMWHDSEVAAIAYAIQTIIAARQEQRARDESGLSKSLATDGLSNDGLASSVQSNGNVGSNEVMAGKKCDACGARAVIKKDGCNYCTACGELGSCG